MIDINDCRVEECALGLKALHGEAAYRAFQQRVAWESRQGRTQINLCEVFKHAKSVVSTTICVREEREECVE